MRHTSRRSSRYLRIARLAAGLLAVLLVLLVPGPVRAQKSFVYDGYTYNFWSEVKDSPPMFRYVRAIDSDDMEGIPLRSVDDVHCAHGLIYIADKDAGRVNVFNEAYELQTSIRLVRDADGKIALDEHGHQVMLKSPQGVFVQEETGELYIADAEARSLYVVDSQAFSLKRVIHEPDAYVGVTDFVPAKVAVDPAQRIYVVVMNSYEGIIELNPDGTFSRYFGVNRPKVNLLDYFWRSIATDVQKQKMQKQFAPSFNNVTVDASGFVFATTYDANAADKVFRLNGKGENVLREEGYLPVIGDREHLRLGSSEFVDVAVTPYGCYAVLDRAAGRVFIYDYDGYLLNVFGSKGDQKGQLKTPVGMAWAGDRLYIADRTLKKVLVYETTAFGAMALKGSEAYYAGKWEEATDYFNEALKLNTNYDLAYVGIGKNHLMAHEYEDAMYYFEKGNSRDYYSSAYEGYRNQVLQEHFVWIFIVLVALIALIFISEYRYHKKEGNDGA